MKFENEAQKTAWERVQPMAQGLFGVFAQFIPDQPVIGIRQGSAVAFVSVRPWHDSAVLSVHAYVARGVTADANMYKYLLDMNTNVMFGAFGLDSDGDVLFKQSILATTLDPDELRYTVMAVLSTADDSDDEIVARWGGKKGTE